MAGGARHEESHDLSTPGGRVRACGALAERDGLRGDPKAIAAELGLTPRQVAQSLESHARKARSRGLHGKRRKCLTPREGGIIRMTAQVMEDLSAAEPARR